MSTWSRESAAGKIVFLVKIAGGNSQENEAANASKTKWMLNKVERVLYSKCADPKMIRLESICVSFLQSRLRKLMERSLFLQVLEYFPRQYQLSLFTSERTEAKRSSHFFDVEENLTDTSNWLASFPLAKSELSSCGFSVCLNCSFLYLDF